MVWPFGLVPARRRQRARPKKLPSLVISRTSELERAVVAWVFGLTLPSYRRQEEISPTLTTGPQFFGKLLILRPRLQKVFTTVSPPYATVSARWETILGDGWDGNCRCNWWSSIW